MEPEPDLPEPALVCGRRMTIPPENYFRAEHLGQVIYFCTEFCLEHFLRDPERFYEAHSRPRQE
jgi:YHS domain-containing protein